MAAAYELKFNKKQWDNLNAFMTTPHDVRIGVMSDGGGESEQKGEIGAVALAAVHEFGSRIRNIPSRSFLRKTMALKQDAFRADIAANRDNILTSISRGQGDTVLAKMGAKWVSYVQDTFRAQGPGWRPLKRATVRRRRLVWTGKYLDSGKKEKKRSHKILWVTGALMRSITWQVRR